MIKKDRYLLSFSYFLNKALWDIGGRYGTDPLIGDNQTAVFLDPADISFRPLEFPVNHSHTFSPTKLGTVSPQLFHSFLAGWRDQHDNIHLPVRIATWHLFQFLISCIQDHLVRELPLYLHRTQCRRMKEQD